MVENPKEDQKLEEITVFIKRENETNSNKTEKDESKINLGICLFSVLNALLISLIGITAYYVSSEKNVIVVHDADICVPCDDLRLHPDDVIEGIKRRGESKTICCATEKEGPDVLIGYYVDHWLKKTLSSGEDREFVRYNCNEREHHRKPIIKLVGKHGNQTAEQNRLQWDAENEIAIVPDDDSITYHKEHGFIEIKKSGLYQVFSQVVLDHNPFPQNPQNGPDIYSHSIIMIEAETSHYKSLREITLMKTFNTHCTSQTNRQTITNYLGGAFQLSEGDKIAVKAHNKTELVPVPHMNFFGAYML